jgi:hypothetical protein
MNTQKDDILLEEKEILNIKSNERKYAVGILYNAKGIIGLSLDIKHLQQNKG